MTIKIHNTKTGQKEEFIPRRTGEVSIYVCGVTPYNFCHIGNARPYVVFDVIRRFLISQGLKVEMIQNFTDIDDKIIAQSNKEGLPWQQIPGRYIPAYFEDMDALGVQRADRYPLVTEHITEIVDLVERLEKNGYAYAIDGDVYFRVKQFKHYGKLSNRSPEEMLSGARVEVDERKEDPLDFALWKSAKEGEPSWPSPWGPGRPGWHIECSAMALKYLGMGFDIHGGGADLVFPHHENEVAQAEAATGKSPFVRYWVHNGWITMDSEKMSKSLGNIRTIKEVRSHWPAEVVRFFLLNVHYRSPLDFTESAMEAAKAALERIQVGWERLSRLTAQDAIEGPAPLLLRGQQRIFLDLLEIVPQSRVELRRHLHRPCVFAAGPLQSGPRGEVLQSYRFAARSSSSPSYRAPRSDKAVFSRAVRQPSRAGTGYTGRHFFPGPLRGQAGRGQHAGDTFEREADHVGEAALDPDHEPVAHVLNSVGAGLALPVTRAEIRLTLGGVVPHPHACDIDLANARHLAPRAVGAALGAGPAGVRFPKRFGLCICADQAHARQDFANRAGLQLQHAPRFSFARGLAQDPSAARDDCIRPEHPSAGIQLGDGPGFEVRQGLDPVPWRLAAGVLLRLGERAGHHVKIGADLRQKRAPAQAGRGQNQPLVGHACLGHVWTPQTARCACRREPAAAGRRPARGRGALWPIGSRYAMTPKSDRRHFRVDRRQIRR